MATEGQVGAALEILRRAYKESRLIMDLSLRAYTLEEVAPGQARAGSMNEATSSLAEAKPIALAANRKIKIEHGWTRIVQDLVELEVEWGDIDGAGYCTSRRARILARSRTRFRVGSQAAGAYSSRGADNPLAE